MANHSQYPLSDVDGKLSISTNAVAAFMTSLSTSGRLQFDRTFDIVLFLLAVGSALVLVVWLLSDGLTEHSTLLFTRYTARLSFLFFLPVFTLHALQVLLPTILGSALLKKRRQFGLAFALAHMVHMVAIIMHYDVMDRWFTAGDTPALVIYLLIGLMAVTSNTFSMVRLKSIWAVLHKVGVYGVFLGFFATYLGRVQEYDAATLHPEVTASFQVYVVLLMMVSVAWLLRIAAFWTLRNRSIPS